MDFDQFDEKHSYCTCLSEMSEVNYLKGKFNERSAAPLMSSIVLKSGIKSCFDGVVMLYMQLKMQL